MNQKRAYKYRFYPTDSQAQTLTSTFGGCRYVYNWALRLRSDAYFDRQERLYYAHLSSALTNLKRLEETRWLTEGAAVPLQQSLRHLDQALLNFFAGHSRYPVFRKKHGRQSAEYTTSAFTWDGGNLKLAKMDKPLKICWSRPLPLGCRPTTVTASRDAAGRYFVSILTEEEVATFPANQQSVGIDLGIHDIVALSTGEKVGNPRFFEQDAKKLKRAQQAMCRKYNGSNNYAKARLRVAKIHEHIADRRRDFLHKLTTRLIRENQTICLESLVIKNMVKNRRLAKAINDVGWGELVNQLEYKAKWYGRTVARLDRFYPSSKRCHNCGYILPFIALSVRQWTCPECDTTHDRDHNAAINIRAAGLAVLASGEAVRPGRIRSNQARLNEGRIPSFQRG